MSTNQTQIQLLSGQNNGLAYTAYEITNAVDFMPDVTLYAHTYARIKIAHEFNNTYKCNKCDVLITNRFTMDSNRFTVNNWLQNDVKINNTDISYYSSYVEQNTHVIELALSMQDFMFGDICIQFYDTNIDDFCPPIIVQFTNAPTIFASDIYKMNSTDEDSVFSASFGADNADSGRTDVFTANSENYYNEVLSADRLITNGKLDNNVSVHYHPTYVITYSSFVPSAFSYQFGNNSGLSEKNKRNSVGFTFANTSAYLTSAVNTTANDLSEMLDDYVAMKCKVIADTKDYPLQVSEDYTVNGHCTKFNTYLTASNTDKWFRKRNRVCTDFVLSGLDPNWLS